MEANSQTTGVGDLVESARPGLRRRLAALLPAGSVNRAGRARKRTLDHTALKLEEQLFATEAVVLHHRQLPGEAGAISHLIIAPSGITLVDARNYTSGRARVGHGGIRVGRRNRSELIHGVIVQAEALHEMLADTPYAEVPVEAALAWRDVEGLPILHSFGAPRVLVCGTRKIAREAARPGPLSRRRVNALAAYLGDQLPAS